MDSTELITVLHFALLWLFIDSAQIDVSVSVEGGNQVLLGSPVTLRCEYVGNNLLPEDAVLTVSWLLGTANNFTTIAGFDPINPIHYPNGEYQPPAYVMTVTYGQQSGSSELAIQSAAMKDNTSFGCAITTLQGIQSSGYATIAVNELASSIAISSHEEHSNNSDATVISGKEETFICNASGSTPPSTISWTLNGFSDPGWPSDDKDTSSLSLEPQWEDHGSDLRCTATVPADMRGVFTNVKLDVKVPPTKNDVILLDEMNHSGYPNDSLVRVDDGSIHKFTCEVSNTRPAANIGWFLDFRGITDGISEPTPPSEDNKLVNHSSTLMLLADVNQHRENLMCRTSINITGAPDPVESFIVLDVYGAPRDLTLSNATDLTEGVAHQFVCKAKNAYPKAEIEWHNNDEDITQSPANNTENSDFRFDVRSVIKFVPTRNDTQHTIKCQLIHAIQNQTKEVVITVKFSATIVSSENQVSVDEGQNATLHCAVTGNPIPDIIWLDKNGSRIANTSRTIIAEISTENDQVTEPSMTSYLTIIKIIPHEDYGNYTCNATNSIGSDLFTIALSGLAIPDVPTDIAIIKEESTERSLTVQWKRGHNGGVEQWFVIHYWKINDDEKISSKQITEEPDLNIYVYTITELEPGEEYLVSVSSGNRIGENSGSQLTDPGITKPLSPEDLHISIVFNSKIDSVTVMGLPDDGIYKCLKLQAIKEKGNTWEDIIPCLNEDTTKTVDEAANAIRGVYCVRGVCGQPTNATDGNPPEPTKTSPSADLGLIVGASVAGIFLIAVIIILVICLLRSPTPTRKGTPRENGQLELALSNGTKQGVDNPAINTVGAPTYAAVHKTKTKTSMEPEEENAYDDVANRNPIASGAKSDDGRTVNPEGLIYQEVSHFKSHPVDTPPIQTEATTEYASLDFNRMKSN